MLAAEGWLTLRTGDNAIIRVFSLADYDDMVVVFGAAFSSACITLSVDDYKYPKIASLMKIIAVINVHNRDPDDHLFLQTSLKQFFQAIVDLSDKSYLANCVVIPLHVICSGLHGFQSLPACITQVVNDISLRKSAAEIRQSCDLALSRALDTWRPAPGA